MKDLLIGWRRAHLSVSMEDVIHQGKSFGLGEEKTKSALRFLNDLGIIVWNQKREKINGTVFLDPDILISCFREVFNLEAVKNTRTLKRNQITDIKGVYEERELEQAMKNIIKLKSGAILSSLAPDFTEKIIKLFCDYQLAYYISNTKIIFPILVDNEEPKGVWVTNLSEVKEAVHYSIQYQHEIPKNSISQIISDIIEKLNTFSKILPSDLFLSKQRMIFPFSLSSNPEPRIVMKEKNDFAAFIHFVPLVANHV